VRSLLVVAPHPDDESLGCGGTLLRARSQGTEIHWLIVTAMTAAGGFSDESISTRSDEIDRVAEAYGFASVHQLGLPTAMLDTIPLGEITGAIGKVVREVAPGDVLLPFRNDIHSDHTVVFDAAASATKSFRAPSIRSVLMYETLSETDFGVRPGAGAFAPQVFVDVHDHLERKLEILATYASEMGEFPFPRSSDAVRALAMLRGAQSGVRAAEAFMLVKAVR
jgi:LmbE family N-acetylglucosaminyl deacetylase